MKLLIFKTDIRSKKKVKTVKPLLNDHPIIKDWSIDLEDIDNVLRIEASGHLPESEIIQLVRLYGLRCEVLPD